MRKKWSKENLRRENEIVRDYNIIFSQQVFTKHQKNCIKEARKQTSEVILSPFT